jgi:plasmid stability protein
MTTQTVTLRLPEPLYRRLEARASQTHRTVEDELLDVLAAAVPVADDLPADLAEAISPISLDHQFNPCHVSRDGPTRAPRRRQ